MVPLYEKNSVGNANDSIMYYEVWVCKTFTPEVSYFANCLNIKLEQKGIVPMTHIFHHLVIKL